MPTCDYALAFDFVDPAVPTVPYRIEFRFPYRAGEDPNLELSNPAGQLIAVVKGNHPLRGTVIRVSRAGVRFNPVEAAVDRDHWPMLSAHQVDLNQIRQRIRAAGLA
jgi:hypothetical protein